MAIQKSKEVIKDKEIKKEVKVEVKENVNALGNKKIDESQFHKKV